MQKYVTNIMEQMKIQMTPLGKIQWKYVTISAGIMKIIGLTLWGVKKYYDSKEKKT